MPANSDVLGRVEKSSVVLFYCPGCDEPHQIDTAKWEFNGDMEKPTFSPSYLTWSDPNPKADPRHDPTGKYRNGFRCHSFIKEGEIEYLSDCSHKLAGKTVQMVSWETTHASR